MRSDHTPPMVTQEIQGPQAWVRDELGPDDWLVPLPEAGVAELHAVVEQLRRDPVPVESLAPQKFDLPTCIRVMSEVRRKLLRGGGLAVVDRVPVDRYSVYENQAIGWVLACTLGQVVAQKWDGRRLYDVKDSGKSLGYGVRRSVTNLGQPFHTDGGWLWKAPAFVGLFCLESALEGGLSRFTSLVTAHNHLLRHPELLARLYQPFAWDRQAEHSSADPPFARQAVFECEHGTLGARYYEDYIHSGQRLAGESLDAVGRDALLALRAVVDDPEHWVEFRIERGQLQYINNRQFAHSRTAFQDAPGVSRFRHMVRLWNRDEGTPDLEGQDVS